MIALVHNNREFDKYGMNTKSILYPYEIIYISWYKNINTN